MEIPEYVVYIKKAKRIFLYHDRVVSVTKKNNFVFTETYAPCELQFIVEHKGRFFKNDRERRHGLKPGMNRYNLACFLDDIRRSVMTYNGVEVEDICYEKHQRHGKSILRFKSGKIRSVENYCRGHLHGECVYFSEAGHKKVYNYVDGKLCGEHISVQPDGTTKKIFFS